MDWNLLVSEVAAVLMALFSVGGVGYAIVQGKRAPDDDDGPDTEEQRAVSYTSSELRDAEVADHLTNHWTALVATQSTLIASVSDQFDVWKKQISEMYESRLRLVEESYSEKFERHENELERLRAKLEQHTRTVGKQQHEIELLHQRLRPLKEWPKYVKQLYKHINLGKPPPPPFPPDEIYADLADEEGTWVGYQQ